MMNDSVWAVVPAAGTGSRMQADKPKQYLPLDGQPVLWHTLTRLLNHPRIEGVVIALSEGDPYWTELHIDSTKPVLTATGGAQRSDSVLSALSTLQEHSSLDPWVLVHDAARPCLRAEDIDKMLAELSEDRVGGILGIQVTDTVKRVSTNGRIERTVSRDGLWRAATPQMFKLDNLKQALEQCQRAHYSVTDEASAMEYCGQQAKMVEGHADNIKITLPKDLALASLFMQQQREESV
jgi:2-C-methyl-D-erythritol 4-phosphate cytidylyltransferase